MGETVNDSASETGMISSTVLAPWAADEGESSERLFQNFQAASKSYMSAVRG